jgi:putative ABC transport system permease protein
MRPLRLLLDDLSQDLKHALRGLRKSPGFAAAVIVTLAFGIGANAAMFGIVDRLMFRPYPYLADPAHTHRLYFQQIFRGERRISSGGLQYTRYTDIRQWRRSFSNFAAFTAPNLAVGVGESARERRVATVSGTLWGFFAARPVIGRFFTPAEDTTPRGADVAVLGYGYWQSEFGGKADVLGKVLQVSNFSVTVIGVAPEGFVGVFAQGDPPALYVPITTYRGWADVASVEPRDSCF